MTSHLQKTLDELMDEFYYCFMTFGGPTESLVKKIKEFVDTEEDAETLFKFLWEQVKGNTNA